MRTIDIATNNGIFIGASLAIDRWQYIFRFSVFFKRIPMCPCQQAAFLRYLHLAHIYYCPIRQLYAIVTIYAAHRCAHYITIILGLKWWFITFHSPFIQFFKRIHSLQIHLRVERAVMTECKYSKFLLRSKNVHYHSHQELGVCGMLKLHLHSTIGIAKEYAKPRMWMHPAGHIILQISFSS